MSVTAKKWRLCVTALSSSSGTSPLHQLEVEATNWMGALREARRELGEEGGLPTGASCAVAPDGTVTILDSESRRKFLLTPSSAGSRTSLPAVTNGQRAIAEKKRHESQSLEAVRDLRPELELLFSRDEEPSSDNPLTYRERAYLIPKGMGVSEAEAQLRFALADLQRQLSRVLRGKLVSLAAFDHRWAEHPERPPLVTLEWRDWRGEPSVDYPAAEQRPRSPSRMSMNAEPDDRLASIFEALHELAHIQTAHEALAFIVKLLESTVPSAAIGGFLYDINTDELRFVAGSGPGAEALRGTALPRSRGLFGRAARAEHSALVVANLHEAPEYDPQVDGRTGLNTENLLLRPVTHDGRLLGMLQFINRASGAFSAPDVHLINYTADRLAEFLQQARSRAQH